MKRKRKKGLHKSIAGVLILAAALHFVASAALAVLSELAMNPAAAGLGPFSDTDNNGWAFTVDSPFFVDGLSAYDPGADGFGGDMLVTLWEHASATLLASAVVPAAGDGTTFPTVAISPVGLSAGVEYSVAAGRVDYVAELWDRWPNANITFNAPVSGARQVYGDYAGLFPGGDGTPRNGYTTAGGNFTFIPEPATLLLLGLSAVMVRRRY